uniref:Uncharacterized protein n=1 Tax=Panagrolaimus superbus TaxID=310955 RepID=A0A914Y5H9_9BILA
MLKNLTAASDSVEGFIETSQEYTFKKLAQRIVYKRAKLVSLSTKDLITVLFVDYGEVVDVPVADIYMYKFSKKVPEFLTVLVSEDKLAKTLQLNDLYIFDFIKEKYIYVGRPTSNFDIAPNPLNDLSTSTESVYFGPGSNDWENEESKNDDEILFVPAAEENKTKKDDELVVYGLEDGWTFEDDANEDSDDSSFVEFESIRNTALENDEDDDYYADQGSVGSRSE